MTDSLSVYDVIDEKGMTSAMKGEAGGSGMTKTKSAMELFMERKKKKRSERAPALADTTRRASAFELSGVTSSNEPSSAVTSFNTASGGSRLPRTTTMPTITDEVTAFSIDE